MQTTFNVNRAIAQEGQTYGPRDSNPYTFPFLAQITTVTIADGSPAAGEAWTLNVRDDDSLQDFPIAFTSGASLALTLDAMLAAIQGDGKLNDLFTAVEDGATVLTMTARNANIPYTITLVPGGSATAVVAITTAAGGAEIDVGLMVARAVARDEMRPFAAGDTADDLAGLLFRTDANHFHDLENDTAAAEDRIDRGRTMAVMEEGRFWALVAAGVVALTDPVHIRVALTGGVGRVGELLTAPAGGQQLLTATPAAVDLASPYGFDFGFRGRHFSARYAGDGTTTVAVAVDGLVASLGTIAGLTIVDNTTDLTIQTAAGEQLDYFIESVQQNDTPAASVDLVETTAADIDSFDASAFMRWESTAAAAGLARARMHKQA